MKNIKLLVIFIACEILCYPCFEACAIVLLLTIISINLTDIYWFLVNKERKLDDEEQSLLRGTIEDRP